MKALHLDESIFEIECAGPRKCEICGGAISPKNVVDVCNRTAECRRESTRAHHALGKGRAAVDKTDRAERLKHLEATLPRGISMGHYWDDESDE